MKTAVQWLFLEYKKREIATDEMVELFNMANSRENIENLKRELFIGKVVEIIGFDKTIELLKECNETFKSE